jgi:hypothetical protein
MGTIYPLIHFRKDKRKLKYYQEILKKHSYWDTRPTLRDDKDQI